MHPQVAKLLSGPLVLDPSALPALRDTVVSPTARDAVMFDALDAGGCGYDTVGSLGIVEVSGVLAPGMGIIGMLMGMCDTEQLAATIDDAADDGSIGTLLMVIDSPGGSGGAMADMVAACDRFKATGKKLVALSRNIAMSGGYWLACQADELYVTATARVGSIGAYSAIEDSSKAAERDGYTIHLVSSTPLKGAGVRGVKITEPQIAAEKEQIQQLHGLFVDAVAAGRGVDAATVEAWANGPDPMGVFAVELGMADGVAGYRELIEHLTGVSTMTTATNPTTTPTKTKTKTASAKTIAAVAGTVGKTDRTEDGGGGGEEKPSYEELEQQVADLKAKVAEMEDEDGEKDEKTEDEKPEEEDGEKVEAHAPGDYVAAFTAAGIEITPDVKAWVFDCQADGDSPASAVRSYRRATGSGAVSAAVRAAAAGADAVTASPPRPTTARAAWDSRVSAVMAERECARGEAVAWCMTHEKSLHAAYVSEANGR